MHDVSDINMASVFACMSVLHMYIDEQICAAACTQVYRLHWLSALANILQMQAGKKELPHKSRCPLIG